MKPAMSETTSAEGTISASTAAIRLPDISNGLSTLRYLLEDIQKSAQEHLKEIVERIERSIKEGR